MSTEKKQVFIDLDKNTKQMLADNGVTLGELLRKNGADVEERMVSYPKESFDGSSRDLGLALVGTAAILAILTPVIIKALQVFNTKPTRVKHKILREITDKDGNIRREWEEIDKVTYESVIKSPSIQTTVKGFGVSICQKTEES